MEKVDCIVTLDENISADVEQDLGADPGKRDPRLGCYKKFLCRDRKRREEK